VQHFESDGFEYQGLPGDGGEPGFLIPCLTGNRLCSLVRLGWLDDPRVQPGLEWLAANMLCDVGRSRQADSAGGWIGGYGEYLPFFEQAVGDS
jgi:hypothetical protein